MRRLVVTLASLGFAVLGTQIAHALAYRLAEPSADQRAHELTGTGHGYLEYATLGMALLLVLAVWALVAEIRAGVAGARPSRPRLWIFAAIAPATFVAQEHLERWFHDGAFPWATALEATFLLGLVLQLPFALAAYALARVLLRAAQAVARLLARPRVSRLAERSSWSAAPVAPPRPASLAGQLGARGPPLLAV